MSAQEALAAAQSRVFAAMTPEELLVFRANNRLTLRELAAHFAVSRRQVEKKLHAARPGALGKPGKEAWADLTRAEAFALAQAPGMTFAAIAALYGVSKDRVCNRFRDWGVRPARDAGVRWSHSARFRETPIAALACLYHEKDWSMPKIAAEYGVAPNTVSRRFARAGVLAKTERPRRLSWTDLPATREARR